MLDEERRNEIAYQYLIAKESSEAELYCLEIQELLFLGVTAIQLIKEEKLKEMDFDKKVKHFYQIVVEKIRSGCELYLAYDMITKYPHIDGSGCAWMFSNEEFAEAAYDYYAQQYIFLTIKRLQGDEVLQVFAEFHRIGIEAVLLDNGQYRMNILRNDVLAPPDYSDILKTPASLVNSKTNFAILQFFQNLYTKNEYEKKKEFLRKLEHRMLTQIISSCYLVPVKVKDKKIEIIKEEEIEIENPKKLQQEGKIIEFATLFNIEEKTAWLPAFTDLEEAIKLYPKEEWSQHIVSYEELLEMSQKVQGIVINAGGMPFRISEKNRARIEEFYQILQKTKG